MKKTLKTSERVSGALWRSACVVASAGLVSLLAFGCSAGGESEQLGGQKEPVVFVPPSELNSGSILVPAGPAYDKRRDIWEEETPVPGEDASPLVGWQWLRSQAQQASVALFNAKDIDCAECSDPNDPDLVNFDRLPRYKDFEGSVALCPDERFRMDPTGAFCSGTLIDHNLILTAGHCIRSPGDSVNDYSDLLAPSNCGELDQNGQPIDPATETDAQRKARMKRRLANLRVVFNFYNPGPGEKPRVSRTKDVFKAVDVVWTPTTGNGLDMGDIAVLQLVDSNGNPRDATPRFQPAPLGELSAPPALGEPLAAIGAPTGIPLKISASKTRGVTAGNQPNVGVRPGATGTGIVDRYSFGSQMDVFGGNSGGGVFSLKDFRLLSWVHDSPGLNIRGTCQNPGLNFCTGFRFNSVTGLCEAQLGKGKTIEKDGHHYIPDGANNCWRSVAIPADFAPEPLKNAEDLLSRFLTPDTPSDPSVLFVGPKVTPSGVKIEHATHRSLELLRLFYCDGQTVDASISADTKSIIDAFNARTSFTAKDDTNGIVKNSRLCQPYVDSGPTPADMRKIELKPAQEITIEGDTSLGSDLVRLLDLNQRCPDNPGAPDAVYSLHIDQPTILYADTFDNGTSQPGGTPFDSMIFLFKVASLNDPPQNWQFSGCFDDSQCTPSNFRQAQFLNFLDAGDYVVGVTGAVGDEGHFQLHLQAVPAASRGEVVIAPSGSTTFANQWPLTSTQSSDPNLPATNAQDAPRCQNLEIDGSPDYQYVMVSCPDFGGGNFASNTISTQTDFDTVITLRQGNQARGEGYDCNDDHGNALINFINPGSRLQSLLGNPSGNPTALFPNPPVELSSGSALRSFYVDAFAFGSGNYSLTTVFPSQAAFSSGAVTSLPP